MGFTRRGQDVPEQPDGGVAPHAMDGVDLVERMLDESVDPPEPAVTVDDRGRRTWSKRKDAVDEPSVPRYGDELPEDPAEAIVVPEEESRRRRGVAGATATGAGRSRFSPRNLVVGLVMLVLLALSGTALIKGLTPHAIDAPLPKASMSAGPNVALVGPDGVNEKVKVKGADDGTGQDGLTDGSNPGEGGIKGNGGGEDRDMSVPDMGNNSVFLPAIGAYAPLLAVDSFTANPAHPGWETIWLPKNPRKASWHSAVPLTGGTHGTTLLAGHVAYYGEWGAFRNLSGMAPGNTIWTQDAKGVQQRWKVTEVFNKRQTSFPQEYWEKDGPRQLVLVTCGGRFVNGHYRDNVFVVAVPVEKDGKPLPAPAPVPTNAGISVSSTNKPATPSPSATGTNR